jgi:gamma-glutamyl hercynylcysteine S-oxide synthase
MTQSVIPDYLRYTPYPSQATLLTWLEDSNSLTRHILQNLQAEQESVPEQEILNPPHWEFGHISWFHEFWVHRCELEANQSWLTNADGLFNSSLVSHRSRWGLQIPDLDTLFTYNQAIFERTADLLDRPLSNQKLYFITLSIFHQDMHNEAFAYMWQTLGYPQPFKPKHQSMIPQIPERDLTFSGQTRQFGSQLEEGFIFDNEKWTHPIQLKPFSIASHPVTNGEYLEFLQSHTDQLATWTPLYWKQDGAQWYERHFDQWQILQENNPVRHIRNDQAQRYCEWRHRRLPTEHELTVLYSSDMNTYQSSGLWEWSSSVFQPFPGFSEDPYLDYSKPWFDGGHQVLKGWSTYTPERLRRAAFRNFYQTKRADMFCGFRTCSIE